MNRAFLYKRGSLGIVLFLLPFFVGAQVKYSNEFMNLGVGARGLAMSNSLTAVANDVTAAYWNPAGLVRMENLNDVLLMHAEYFAGIAAYDYVGYARRFDDCHSIAINLMRFAVDDIPNTTLLIDQQGNINYNRISYFTAADWAMVLSYSHILPVEGLSVGGNVKLIHRRIGDFAGSWGFGLDLAAQYRLKQWSFGLMAHDVTTTFNAWSQHLSSEEKAVFAATGNELPENGMEYTRPHLSLGAAYQFVWKSDYSMLVALNAESFFDGKRNELLSGNTVSVAPALGLEFGYRNMVFLRAGVGNFQHETDFDGSIYTSCQLNAGLGVCIKKHLYVDYAFSDLGDLSIALYSHIFSLRYTFCGAK